MKSRPDIVPSVTYKMRTNCGSLYIIVTIDDELKPFEVFAYLGHSGSCTSAQINGLSISISLGLRSGVVVDKYISHLRQVRCGETTFAGEKATILSCANAIAQVMEKVRDNQQHLSWANDYWAILKKAQAESA